MRIGSPTSHDDSVCGGNLGLPAELNQDVLHVKGTLVIMGNEKDMAPYSMGIGVIEANDQLNISEKEATSTGEADIHLSGSGHREP